MRASRLLRSVLNGVSAASSAEATALSTARGFAGAASNLTGVSTSGPAKWPPKDPRGEWLQTQQRFEVLLKNNPLPKDRPWEVDHHDDHHDDHGHGHGAHGHDDHGHGAHGNEDNKWYEDDSVMDPHEPAATKENPCFVTPYIKAYEEDGVWVVERERDPTFEEEVRFRVMKLITFFDNVMKLITFFDNVDVSKIRKESRFLDLGLDSLDVVELQMAIEEEFGVQIPDDLAERLWSVEDAVQVLCNEERVWGPYKEENIQKWADWYWEDAAKRGRTGW